VLELLALEGQFGRLLARFFDGDATGGELGLPFVELFDLLFVPAFGGGQREPDAEGGGGGERGGREEARLARVEGLLRGDVARDEVDAVALGQDEARCTLISTKNSSSPFRSQSAAISCAPTTDV